MLAPVRALLATAVEEGLIRSNPAAGVRIVAAASTPDGEEQRVKALTEEELQALLAQLVPDPEAKTPQPEWRFFVEFLSRTGLRIGEAIALEWRHVDFVRRRVLVRRRFYRGSFAPPKSRYGRRDVPLSPAMASALWRLRMERRAGDGELVFVTARERMVDPSNAMSRVLKPAAVRAGLGEWAGQPLRAERWVGWHTLRHTCATTLFRGGVIFEAPLNAKQVQVWLGHHSPAFTLERYVHLLPDDLPDDFVGAAEEGHTGATRPTETARESGAAEGAEILGFPGETRQPEVAAALS
jgi:integrase